MGLAPALLELNDPRRGCLVVHGGETVVLSGAGKTAPIRADLPRQGRRPGGPGPSGWPWPVRVATRRPLLVVDGELDPALCSLLPGVLEEPPDPRCPLAPEPEAAMDTIAL